MRHETDLKTGESTTREWTAEEIAAHEEAIARDAPSEKQLALQELQATENTADLARKIEDITTFIVDGTPLPVNAATNKPYAQEWMEERKGLRAKL